MHPLSGQSNTFVEHTTATFENVIFLAPCHRNSCNHSLRLFCNWRIPDISRIQCSIVINAKRRITCSPSLYFSNDIQQILVHPLRRFPSYLIWFAPVYRYASVNVSADDAYTPTVRGFLSAIFTDRDHT